MFDFLADHQLYIVMLIVLLIWAGFVIYLFRLDGRISKLEEMIQPKPDQPVAEKK
ncbi:MAG: CcmD family protein [Bacteroidota bacterium]|nr:CcmD family protein [Bacteroidota bacterium]